MKYIFFVILFVAALMQVKSSRKSASAAPKQHPLTAPPIAQSSIDFPSVDVGSMISSVAKMPAQVIDKSLPQLETLTEMIPPTSLLGSMINGIHLLFANQQIIKMFDRTIVVLKSDPSSVVDSNNSSNNDSSRMAESSQVNENIKIGKGKVDKYAIEDISNSKASQRGAPENKGYLVHFSPDNRHAWRTKNTKIIKAVVYDQDYSLIADGGYTEYISLDGKTKFKRRGDGRVKSNVSTDFENHKEELPHSRIKTKEPLVINSSLFEDISNSALGRRKTPENKGYLVYFSPDGRIWRTKNKEIIKTIVHEKDYSYIENGYTEYRSLDGKVRFKRNSDGNVVTNVPVVEE